jgi:hypothetical protein
MSSSNTFLLRGDNHSLEKQALGLSAANLIPHPTYPFFSTSDVDKSKENLNDMVNLGPRLFSGYQGVRFEQRSTHRQPKYDEVNFPSAIYSESTNSSDDTSNYDDLFYMASPVRFSVGSAKVTATSNQVQSKIVSTSVKAGLSELFNPLPTPPRPPAIVSNKKDIAVYEVRSLVSCAHRFRS